LGNDRCVPFCHTPPGLLLRGAEFSAMGCARASLLPLFLGREEHTGGYVPLPPGWRTIKI